MVLPGAAYTEKNATFVNFRGAPGSALGCAALPVHELGPYAALLLARVTINQQGLFRHVLGPPAGRAELSIKGCVRERAGVQDTGCAALPCIASRLRCMVNRPSRSYRRGKQASGSAVSRMFVAVAVGLPQQTC